MSLINNKINNNVIDIRPRHRIVNRFLSIAFAFLLRHWTGTFHVNPLIPKSKYNLSIII